MDIRDEASNLDVRVQALNGGPESVDIISAVQAVMEDIHRELLKKRQKYVMENVIMEAGILQAFKDKALFTDTMIFVIQSEKDPERQISRMLEMVTKRGPEAYNRFLDCLRQDYPWVVQNFREKEVELANAKGKPDVIPEVRRTVKEYVKELAKTTRINHAQSKAIEDFLCRHIVIDTNLSSASSHGNRLFGIHRQLLSAIPVTSLDESGQMELNDVIPENVSIDKIEKEVTLLVERVNDLQTTIDSCYEKIGEPNKEKELPDLVYALRKLCLEKEIRIEEIKNQMMNTTRQIRLAKDRARKAQEASQKNEEEKEELHKSLDMLKIKIQKLQEERQKMGMKMAFDANTSTGGFSTSTAPSSPNSRTRSSRSQDWKISARRNMQDDRASVKTFGD